MSRTISKWISEQCLAMPWPSAVIACLTLSVSLSPLVAQEPQEVTEKLAAETLQEGEGEAEKIPPADQAHIHTRKDARTITMMIPGVRGLITDRFGQVIAQNKVVWYPALQMQQFEDESDAHILSWSRDKIATINAFFGTEINLSDKALLEHYRHRRWIPMPFKHEVTQREREKFEKEPLDGVVIHPSYQRYYPEGSSAAHVIGYVGSKKKDLEKGPINYNDPLFWELEGRRGIERIFNDVLTGESGQRKLQYNSEGVEVLRKDTPPKAGGTVILTLDLKWQLHAERVLKRYSNKGAFVVIDVETGEVLVLASRPSYDLNLWVPYMKPDDYQKLLNDESKPLFGRAFQATYPPASTFKVITALAALDSGAINKWTRFDCPDFIKLGNHKFYDWSRKAAGSMNVLTGLMRSNNPFFIQTALATEKKQPGYNMTLARMMGFGTVSGLPLDGEASGNLLSNEYTQKKYKRTIKQGDTANASIGQGAILATPLQVAQAMAAVANGGKLHKLQLIKQVQDDKGMILSASKPDTRGFTQLSAEAVKIVKQGMYMVVNDDAGTGKKAATNFSVISGKTGTAQWGPESKEQKLAWFAGFMPMSKPKYAFAVLYEGRPHEEISGGTQAGRMVPAFFNELKEEAFARHELKRRAMIVLEDDPVDERPAAEIDVPAKALIVEDGIEEKGDTGVVTPEPPRALIVEDDEDGSEEGVEEQTTPVPQPEGNNDTTTSEQDSSSSQGSEEEDVPRAVPVEE